jgi:ABC-2 type transport system ATP-binding protein
LTASALQVASLSHAFGKRRVLDDVSLTIAPGDFCVLLGLNGAGKTTLFALITRLYHATSGRIAVFGHDMRAEPLTALALMGVVFQQSTLDLDLTVAQNLRYHAALHGMSGAEAAPRIAAELDRVGLAERARPFCCSTSRRWGSTSKVAGFCSPMCGCCAASRGSACCGRPT